MRKEDAEWNAFVADNARAGGLLVLGRITYELMAGYWPTPQAIENDPMDKAAWNNTKLVKGGLAAEVRTMKSESGKGMAILGSGSIVSQLAQEGLIDEYQIVVNPIVLGQGRTMFDGSEEKLALRLKKTRTFGNGNILLCYEPMA